MSEAKTWFARWGEAEVLSVALTAVSAAERRAAEEQSKPKGSGFLLASRTHTWKGQDGWLLQAGLNPADRRVRAIGIDLEAADREVSAAAKERIGSLEEWVIREACFKACRPLGTVELVTDVQLGEGIWSAGGGQGEFRLIRDASWVLAVAVLLE